MAERFVEIQVRRDIRDLVKKAKGALSYNEFFEKILSRRLSEKT
jgi:hypothetical protein